MGWQDFHPKRVHEDVRIPIPNPAGAKTARINFGYTGGNNWWWSVDDVKIFGRPSDKALLAQRNVAPLVLMHESFEGLEMRQPVDEKFCPDNGAWTDKAPPAWTVDNSKMGSGGVTEFKGWTFMSQTFWQATAGDQTRGQFARNSVIAVADSDEWDDTATSGDTHTILRTGAIAIDNKIIRKQGLTLNFMSSWRPSGNQKATLLAKWLPSGTEETLLVFESEAGASNYHADKQMENIRLQFTIPDQQDRLQLSFQYTAGRNQWWWALDDIEVAGLVDLDECLDKPCQNNGKCMNTLGSFTCNCDGTGHTGDLCEADVDECQSDPCQNGGSCKNAKGSYACSCSGTGFRGAKCDTNVNECSELGLAACSNGGKCIDKPGSYACDCNTTGYTGPTCEENVNECANSPCMFGRCADKPGTYTCDCKGSGYTGRNCETEINECEAKAPVCKNGGNCTNTQGDYTCECTGTGYQGKSCQDDVDECGVSKALFGRDPCHNGG